ncbi:MAG: alpha/beta fold hydrolase [Deltaproteobacteria bacterium]|nr:alpha/beta fold hydrolase [Deltaproteobacteria bacterium]
MLKATEIKERQREIEKRGNGETGKRRILSFSDSPCRPFSDSALLFIHGWATDSWVWKNQVREFSKEYDVVNVDLPGHGGKDRWSEPTLQPAVKKVLQLRTPNSKLRTYVGIGWSLGASVLIATAARYPELFKGLVLIGATPCFVKRDNFPHAQPKSLVKGMLKDLKNDPKKTLARFYPLNFTDEEQGLREAEGFIKHYNSELQTPNSKLSSSLEALINMDLRDDIKNINIPTLVIHGDKDMVCPVSAGKYLAENIKGASLKNFKDTGHAPFLTMAKEFNKEVRRFLKTL